MNYNYFTGSELDVFDGRKGGLYLVGSCNFNPLTDEKYYWIKVGVAKIFKKEWLLTKLIIPCFGKTVISSVKMKLSDTI